MRSVRGLLKGKKSTQKMDQDSSNSRSGGSLPPRDVASGERVFPIRNLKSNVDLYRQASHHSNGTREGVISTVSEIHRYVEIISCMLTHIQSQTRDLHRTEHYQIAPSVTSDGGFKTPRQSSSGGSTVGTGSRSGAASPRVSARSQFVSSKSGPPGVLQGIDPDMDQYRNIPGYRRCEDEVLLLQLVWESRRPSS